MPVDAPTQDAPTVSARKDSAQLVNELNKIAAEGGIMTVSNPNRGIVTHTDDATHVSLEWAAKDDAAGKDIQQCPASLLASPQFRSTLLQGILVVEDGPEALVKALDAQRSNWDSRQQSASDAKASLERSQNRVVARSQTCIAPKGGERGVLCGNVSLVLGANPNEKPPLCAEHAGMVNQYVPVPSGRIVDNHEEMTWRRITTGRNG